MVQEFLERIELRAAKIVDVQRHPKADKLYIETIDLGSETRKIVSGLVPFYREDELLDKKIVVVTNLKPAKLRGVESQGMLLAAKDKSTVEVLFVPDAEIGERLAPQGLEGQVSPSPDHIDIDAFFEIPIAVKDKTVLVDDVPLLAGGRPITTEKVENGKVE